MLGHLRFAAGIFISCYAFVGASLHAQQRIATADPNPVFVASGGPRAQFGRAYVPDNGRESDIYARDLGYLGIGFEEYVSLNEGNISALMRDDDFVAVLPPALLANPNFGYMTKGGFFAFRSGLDGLEPVEIVAPDGSSIAAADISVMTGAPPVVGADRARTVLIAGAPLPREGAIGFGLYNMTVDATLLQRILNRNGLTAGATSPVSGAEAEAWLRKAGAGLLFMAASQNDPALAPVLSDPSVELFAATNFGLTPVRAAAAPAMTKAAPKPAPVQPQASAEPKPKAEPQKTAARFKPPQPVELVTDLAKTDEVILVLPYYLDPAELEEVTLVWRLGYDRIGARAKPSAQNLLYLRRSTPFISLTDRERIERMLAQVRAALPGVRARSDGPFNDLEFEGRGLNPQVVVNMEKGKRALAIPLQLALDGNYAAGLDGGLTFWTVRGGALQRIRRLSRPYSEGVNFADLDDSAMVVLSPAGMNFDPNGKYLGGGKRTEPMRYQIPSFVYLERGGEAVKTVDFKERNSIDHYFRERVFDAMILPHSDFGGDPIRFDLDTGLLSDEQFFILRAGDLRHPDLAPLLAARAVGMTLRAVRQDIPIRRAAAGSSP